MRPAADVFPDGTNKGKLAALATGKATPLLSARREKELGTCYRLPKGIPKVLKTGGKITLDVHLRRNLQRPFAPLDPHLLPAASDKRSPAALDQRVGKNLPRTAIESFS